MWIPVLVVVATVAMGAYLYPLIRMDYTSQREVDRLEAQLTSLQERNEELRDDVARLKTPEGVERAARESLGYVKPGENAYVVVDDDDASAVPTEVVPPAETMLDEEPGPWWRGVLDAVFGVSG